MFNCPLVNPYVNNVNNVNMFFPHSVLGRIVGVCGKITIILTVVVY